MELRSTAMELLPLVCLCLLTWSGTTFADGNEPKIISVSEGSDATLPCSLSPTEDLSLKRFVWKKDGQKEVFLFDGGSHFTSGQDPQYTGRVSHFKEELRNGNASITISNTRRADNGIYTCEFAGHQICHIKLVFDGPLKDRRGENIPGAAPEPAIITLDETKDGVQLQCLVKGASPKPLVQWQDRAGNNVTAEEPQVSKRGDRYDVTLQTTVTKTGHYRCVATQEEIKHQIYTETYVPVHGGIFNTVTIACVIVIGVLFLLVVVLAVTLCRRNNRQRGRY